MAPTVRSTSSQRHKYELQMTVKGNGLILIRINQRDNEQYIVLLSSHTAGARFFYISRLVLN